jgi:hypothetical protein
MTARSFPDERLALPISAILCFFAEQHRILSIPQDEETSGRSPVLAFGCATLF